MIWYLKRAWHALLCLRGTHVPKNEYEIIVVDDASTQNTKQLITQILDSIKQQNVTHKQLPQLHFLKHEKNKRQGGGAIQA